MSASELILIPDRVLFSTPDFEFGPQADNSTLWGLNGFHYHKPKNQRILVLGPCESDVISEDLSRFAWLGIGDLSGSER